MKEPDLVAFPLRDGVPWMASLPANGENASLARKNTTTEVCASSSASSVLQHAVLSLLYPSPAKYQFPLTLYFARRAYTFLSCLCFLRV